MKSQLRAILDTEAVSDVTIPNTGNRTVVECLPINPAAPNAPLLVLLCGGTSDGSSFTPLCPAFSNGGIIAAFPNPDLGSSKTWNAGDCCEPASINKYDDVGFITKIIDYYLATYPNIDRNRIFVGGLSNGGMLAFRAARNDSRIAGVFASSTTDSSMSEANPGRKIHFALYHGTSDTNIPTNGGTGGLLTYVKPSQQAVLQKWSTSNQCTSNTTTAYSGYTETLFNCPNSVDMKYELVNNVAHQWQMMPAFNTTAELVKFVNTHQRIAAPATPSLTQSPSKVPSPSVAPTPKTIPDPISIEPTSVVKIPSPSVPDKIGDGARATPYGITAYKAIEAGAALAISYAYSVSSNSGLSSLAPQAFNRPEVNGLWAGALVLCTTGVVLGACAWNKICRPEKEENQGEHVQRLRNRDVFKGVDFS